MFRDQAALCLFYGAHDGRVARCVLVDTDAKVDLGVAVVGLVGLHQGQDLVRGLRLKRLEHRGFPLGLQASCEGKV